MAMPKPFPHVGFLSQLEHISAPAPMSSLLTKLLLTPDGTTPTPASAQLTLLLKARQAVLQAAFDTDAVADGLRRYQKFAKPGRPTPQIVQLRQRQGMVRLASSQSRQAFVQAATAFVREAGLEVPARVGLELFIVQWLETNVPQDVIPAA